MQYYLDNALVHTNTRNVPHFGGSLQLKLWADGNKWWSGRPSKTDVVMHVKSIVAYFNTTASGTDAQRANECAVKKSKCVATYLSSHGEAKPQVLSQEQVPKSPATRIPLPTADSDTAGSKHDSLTPEDSRVKIGDKETSTIDLKIGRIFNCTGHKH